MWFDESDFKHNGPSPYVRRKLKEYRSQMTIEEKYKETVEDVCRWLNTLLYSDTDSEIELAIEAILNSIITGHEVDCQSYTDNCGNVIKTIFLKNGKAITLNQDEFSKVFEEVWKILHILI